MIAIGFLIVVVLMIASACYSEHMGARDALYSNPQALAHMNAQAYIQARGALRKVEGQVKRGAPITIKRVVKHANATEVLNNLSGIIGAARHPAQGAKSVPCVEPRFVTIARARSTARMIGIGIRLRPVCQAMRKAYMREVNRLGLDFEAAREIDRMLIG